MDDAEMQAENELVADLHRMARTIQADLRTGESPTEWKDRRAEIAALRQRVRTMRARHLGGSSASPHSPGMQRDRP
jgi:hypothetical protein